MTIKELKDILNEYGDECDDYLVTCYCTSPCIGYANVINRAYVGKTYVNKPSNWDYSHDEKFWPILRTLQLQIEIPKYDLDEYVENHKE